MSVAGVQNVFAVPECRGRGLAELAMRAIMEEAGRRGRDQGLLFCLPKLERWYLRLGWFTLPDVPVTRVEDGRECPLPGKNIAMSYPLGMAAFPPGPIHLQGNDW